MARALPASRCGARLKKVHGTYNGDQSAAGGKRAAAAKTRRHLNPSECPADDKHGAVALGGGAAPTLWLRDIWYGGVMKHAVIRWNPATREHFCTHCVPASDAINIADAQQRLEKYDCIVPSIDVAIAISRPLPILPATAHSGLPLGSYAIPTTVEGSSACEGHHSMPLLCSRS